MNKKTNSEKVIIGSKTTSIVNKKMQVKIKPIILKKGVITPATAEFI